jgi:uncharacterized protein YdhG (YjbR/CyaY superfamily)
VNTKPASVDAYLSELPDAARKTLESLRITIKAAAPDAVELIAYGMPGFKYRGKPLVYYAALKNHCALYGLDSQRAERAGYDTSQKGTIRFPPDAPPPATFVQELLGLRIAAIEAESAGSKTR